MMMTLRTTDEYAVRAAVRRWGDGGSRELNRNTRVYIDDAVAQARDEDLRDLAAAEAALGELRFQRRGDLEEVDNLYDMFNVAITRVKRAVALEVVGAVFTGLGRPVVARFSRYAGCSCPCSPGVVLNVNLRVDGAPVDLWVETTVGTQLPLPGLNGGRRLRD